MSDQNFCPVCGHETAYLGVQRGVLDHREFLLRHCESCRFSYVENFREDLHAVYDERYYNGLGADPSVDYIHELSNPQQTVRNYEWEGVLAIFRELSPSPGARWLDFGCGSGGLVRYAINAGIDAVGFEEGWAADQGRKAGIPILRSVELEANAARFNFVTAIEVLEHVPDPVKTLSEMRALLKPGGILFATTGNSRPWRNKLLNWSYAKCPDVHISFFEPETMSLCMSKAGLRPTDADRLIGYVNIIKFKVLKAMKVRTRSAWIDVLPWRLISAIVDRRYRVSGHPYGVAIDR